MSDLPLPADVGRPLDPTRPIPPSAQPARLAALEAAVRERTDLVPAVGIVLGSGLGGLADDLEDPVAIPFAELPGLAGRDRARTCRPAAPRDARRHARRHAPGPVPPVRGQPPGPRHRTRAAVPAAGRDGRRADQRRGRPRPLVRAGDADAHDRPHQPDRAQPAHRPERRHPRPAVPRHDRCLEPAPARAPARRGDAPRTSPSPRGSTSG